jgi:hypothetical protein
VYLGLAGPTCLAEVFQASRTIDLATNDPYIVALATHEPLRLLDLSGLWPTTAGASMAINSGPHNRARAWSRTIYSAYPEAQGLWYCSSMHANEPCVALYERGQPALPSVPVFQAALADLRLRPLIDHVANTLNYDVVPPRH